MRGSEVDITIVGIFGVVTVLGASRWWSAGFAFHFTWWLVPMLLVWLLLLYATGLWVWAHLRRAGSPDR